MLTRIGLQIFQKFNWIPEPKHRIKVQASDEKQFDQNVLCWGNFPEQYRMLDLFKGIYFWLLSDTPTV